MAKHLFVSLLLSFIVVASSAYSVDMASTEIETQPWQHALAMHGTPKYNTDFKHLEYANPDAPKGGTLKEGVVGSFDTLNDHIILGEMAKGLELTSDPLMQRVWDEPFTLYGLVAQEIKISPRRDWVLFKLNPKAVFHDGTPMTAVDVKYSFEMYRKHGHPVRRRVYSLVKNVEVRSDQEILFKFGEGYDQETALILAIMPVLPKHYWTQHDISKTTLTPPLGSGPYKIKNVDAGRSITYERVENYWAADLPINKGSYNFDTITYSYYRDTDIALEAFKAGETDIRREYDIAAWQKAYKSPRLESGAFVKTKFVHARPEKVKAFVFNTRREPFDQVNVRRALSLAFHFDQINEIFYSGAFNRIQSYFPNSELSHHKTEGIIPFVYPTSATPQAQRNNMRQAKKLLSDAGYVIKDKKLVNAETGAPFTFEILLQNASDEKIALFYKSTLQRLGITANIRTVDTAQFTGRLDQFDYDVILYQWYNSLSPGAEQMNYWGKAAAITNGSRNYAGVSDDKIDALALSIGEAETRTGLVAQARALDNALMHKHYSIPLWYLGADLIAHDRSLRSVDYAPMYGTVNETWWREK